jgi:hypothetical protein
MRPPQVESVPKEFGRTTPASKAPRSASASARGLRAILTASTSPTAR